MPNCSRKITSAAIAVLILSLLHGFAASGIAQGNEESVGKSSRFIVDFWDPPILGDTLLCGDETLWYSDPHPDPLEPEYWIMETEMKTMELKGKNGTRITLNPAFPSIGQTRVITPPDYPAESFFDVYFQIETPMMPGELLTNYAPMHITSIVDQFPPYFEKYEYPMGSPPIILYNSDGEAVGEILWWEEEVRPAYPPEAHVHVETSYKSDVAMVRDGRLTIKGSVSGKTFEGYPVEFGYRTDPSSPFTIFHSGYSEAVKGGYSTVYELEIDADNSGYFDPGSDPFDGQVAEFEMGAYFPDSGWLRDTVQVFMDGVPPIPEFHDIPRDSIGYYQIDSFFDITYRLDDELIGPATAALWLFPLQKEYERVLTPIDQLGLGTDCDTMSCAPTAAACCLKYFAENGHSDLDNPKGNESKPDQTGEEMARELQDAMGTDDGGTTPDEMVSGIESYLGSHGKSGWTVEHGEVNDAADLAEMLREFEADGEDVLLLLQDTTAAGDTIGHVVTLGSKRSDYFETEYPSSTVGEPVQGVDFMDPWGGGTTEDNDYDLDENDEGNPTTSGYDLDGAGGDAWICGYIKVSPPEGGSPSIAKTLHKAPAMGPGWQLASAGIVRGNGMVDTLYWDTHEYAGGLYLMEVATTDDQGYTCTDIRLAGIPSYTVGDETPGLKTMLRGSYPNPFNPNTTVEFSLARGTKVTLAIYDVTGRRIRLLLDHEYRLEGVHRIAWDGRADDGRQVSSGVYFCRFLAEGQVEARKLILLR